MKIPIQQLKSSKLFYNKWPYKIECRQLGASKLHWYSVAKLAHWCETGRGVSFGRSNTPPDPREYLNFINAASKLLTDETVRVRIEDSHFNVFCMDVTKIESVESTLENWITKISGPTTEKELDFLISNGHKKILCENLPHKKYQYKIYFKLNFHQDSKKNFSTWCANYGSKVKIDGQSLGWLKGVKHYAINPFMYVENDKMLSMIGMYLSGNIKKVEHFILRDTALAA